MENLSPIQKLDFVFNYIKSHNQQQITSAKTIAFWVNPKGEEIVTPEEALIIIRKLIKDGYVDEFPSSHIMLGDLEIKISFKGLLFHGYEEQERIETQQQFIADQNEKRINRNERLFGKRDVVRWACRSFFVAMADFPLDKSDLF